MIARNQFVQHHRKQRSLTTRLALNKAHNKDAPDLRGHLLIFITPESQSFVTACLFAPFSCFDGLDQSLRANSRTIAAINKGLNLSKTRSTA